MVRIFREATGVPLWQAIRMASLTPAEILGVDHELGSLRPGKAADIILLTDACEVYGTWIAGQKVN